MKALTEPVTEAGHIWPVPVLIGLLLGYVGVSTLLVGLDLDEPNGAAAKTPDRQHWARLMSRSTRRTDESADQI